MPSCGSIRRRERRTLSTRRLRRWFTTGIWSGRIRWRWGGRDALHYLDAGESFASFQRGAGSAAAAVLSVQGTDGRDAGDAVRAEGLNRNFTESVTGNSRLHFFVRLLSLLCEEHS